MSRTWAVFRRHLNFSSLNLTILIIILFPTFSAKAQNPVNPSYIEPKDRITSFIDDEHRVTLTGNRHPMAIAKYDAGAVPSTFPMQHMILTLLPDSSQQEALDQFVQAQHNPDSPYYHQWLTPEQYAERYGVSDADAARIVEWLQEHGFQVEEITAGRRAVIFSGSAARVQEAFHTTIHTYKVGEQVHHANASDPEIPAALAPVVGGVVSLHDFHSTASNHVISQVSPEFTSGGAHYLAPADFATIYDLNPVYQQAITGSGQSIAIVARSNINLADIIQFRSYFGLPANNPQVIVNGTDPGISNSAEETEADLDAEWSGAVAKNASIKLVVSQSTNSSDGVNLSAQYIVNHNVAPVMSTSFGSCEQSLGASGNSFLNSLWQQAAAQGITVFVSSGDNGAAGCDSSEESRAVDGLAVNGLCSTPYSICVGGAEFNDTSAPSLYWLPSNAGATQGSALSYIPEVVWNESTTGGLWASGGGASAIYAKPYWQSGTGVPADGKRDVPDVSLSAAGHDGYLIVQSGGLYVVGGTSAASPSFAGVMALVVQHAANRQGNANSVFYPLAAKQRSGGAAVFHDITGGNNSVPGQTGFNATVGYDQATGLGTVDASLLVEHWSDGIISPTFQLNASASALAVSTSSSSAVTVTVAVSGGFSAAVAFSVSGLPTGLKGAFTPATLPAPGSGSSQLKFTATSTVKPGVYSVTISAASGSIKQTKSLSVTVGAAPMFTLLPSSTAITVAAGASATLTLHTAANSTFNSAITLSVTGLPSGVTAQFLPSSLIAAPGERSTPLTLIVARNVAHKSYELTLVATSGGITERHSLTLTISSTSRHGSIQR
jgi:pseudomonalisin